MQHTKWLPWAFGLLSVVALVLTSAQNARSVYSSPVSVVNTVNASGSALNRVQLTLAGSADANFVPLLDAHGGGAYTVPAGKRLVLEHASLFAYPGGGGVFSYWWDGFTFTALPVVEQEPGSFEGSVQLRDYVDPGQQVQFSIFHSTTGSWFWDVHVNGYLVDCAGTC